MNSKKEILCLVLTLVCLFTAACSSRKEAPEPAAAAVPADTAPAANEPADIPAEPASASEEQEAPIAPPRDRQIEILESMSDLWMHDSEFEHWFHTFTDLDHNGRYEVITASLQGTGLFTYSDFYELSEDYLSVEKCIYPSEAGSSMCDIITSDPVDCYYDAAEDTYYYIFTDFIRNGAMESWECKMSLSLKDGTVTDMPLASAHYLMDDNGEYKIDYSDAQGAACTEDQFNNAAAANFSGMALTQVTLEWIDETPIEIAEPDSVIPEEGRTGNITVTKNPRGETVAQGGKTWFIAGAENYDTATWEMMSPDGVYHSLAEAMSLCPGTELSALDDTTLAVSSVTASLNGWAAVMHYENAYGSVRTEPAFIYVEG